MGEDGHGRANGAIDARGEYWRDAKGAGGECERNSGEVFGARWNDSAVVKNLCEADPSPTSKTCVCGAPSSAIVGWRDLRAVGMAAAGRTTPRGRPSFGGPLREKTINSSRNY